MPDSAILVINAGSSVLQELHKCIHFAPLHIPLALQLIERAERSYPQVQQIACFDTAFHNTIPECAARFPIPQAFYNEGIRRYGFHGLSYESIIYQLDSRLRRRVVVAHLGSGASLTAVYERISVDTAMGLTPAGGIPMASRSGDVDPGVLLYLLRSKYANPESLEELLNHDAGLKALSGGMSDMRDIEAAAAKGDQKAQLAIEIFVHPFERQLLPMRQSLEVWICWCSRVELGNIVFGCERMFAGALHFSASLSMISRMNRITRPSRQRPATYRFVLSPAKKT